MQLPAEHPAVPFATVHRFWHAPQLFGSPWVGCSQPSIRLWSQSPQPPAQTSPHTPCEQTGVECGPLWQRLLHAPQLAVSVLVFVSQPFASTWSQSAKPGLHSLITHTAGVCVVSHAVVAFGTTQLSPQNAQFWRVPSATLQPSAGLPSQLVDPLGQTRPHIPITHDSFVAQAMPQPSQLPGSLPVFVSQPFAGSSSQSMKPAAQAPIAHLPAAQVGVALGSEQTVPQLPQLVGSVPVSISQPFAGSSSQSTKPASHAPTTHAPPMQTGVAFGTSQGAQVVGPQPYMGSSTATQAMPHVFCPAVQPVAPPPWPPVPPSTPPSWSPDPPWPPTAPAPPAPPLPVAFVPVPVPVSAPLPVCVLPAALQPNQPATRIERTPATAKKGNRDEDRRTSCTRASERRR